MSVPRDFVLNYTKETNGLESVIPDECIWYRSGPDCLLFQRQIDLSGPVYSTFRNFRHGPKHACNDYYPVFETGKVLTSLCLSKTFSSISM